MRMKIKLILLLALAAPVSATTHYVTPAGAGTNSGADWTNAFAGLPASLTRGDTYVLAGSATAYGPHTFSDTASGTTQIHIRKAQAGTYNGTVYNDDLVAGWSSSFQTTQALVQGACSLWPITTAYYDIDGVTPGSTFPPPTTASSYGIKLNQSNTAADCELMDVSGSNARVQHLAFVTAGNSNDVLQFGIVFVNAPNGYVGHNYFINAQNQVRMLGSQHMVVEYNFIGQISYFGDHHGEMVEMNPQAGTPPSDTTVRYNWIDDNGTTNTTGQIIDLGNSGDTNDGVYIYGNVCLNWTGHNGIGSGNSGAPATLTNWKIYDNTFINSVVDFTTFSTGGEFRNNLMYGSDLELGPFGPAPSTRTNNYCNTTTDGIGSTCTTTSSESTSVLFQNYAGADYRLGSASAARNIGFTLSSPYNVDAYGTTRVPGSWDAGAFQFVTNNPTPAPAVVMFVGVIKQASGSARVQ
jgi:hypothetical protein